MPIYTYRCKKCGKEFDWLQSINSLPLSVCPSEICEQHDHEPGEVEKVFSANVGLIFKGSGFYLTDYNKKNSSSASNNGHNNGHNTNGNNSNGHQETNNSKINNKTSAKLEQS